MQITNLKITPEVVAPGEKISVSFTVKNDTKKDFEDELIVSAEPYLSTLYRQRLSLARGKQKNISFEYTVVITEGQDHYKYLQEHRCSVDTQMSFLFLYTETEVVDLPNGITVLDSRYKPSVKTFEFIRCTGGSEDDEGENLRMELALAASETAKPENMTLKLYYAEGNTVTTSDPYYDLTANISDLLRNSESEFSVLNATFDKNKSWAMMIEFGDRYEMADDTDIVPHSFANVHLSGAQKGGVCFGGFSKSDDTDKDAPAMFESYFPAYLYGGIAQIGNGWIELATIDDIPAGAYGGGKLRCRAIEDKRIVAGSVYIKPGTSAITLAALPEGFAPATDVFSLNACSGGRIARIRASSNGTLDLEWVKNLSDGNTYASDKIWVQCSIEYWVD